MYYICTYMHAYIHLSQISGRVPPASQQRVSAGYTIEIPNSIVITIIIIIVILININEFRIRL